MPNSLSQSKRYARRGDAQFERAVFSLEPRRREKVDGYAQALGTTRAAVLREIHLLGTPLFLEQHPELTPNEG